MKTILIAWELGGGLGHLLQLAPVVKGLAQRGHRVVLALKDLSRARAVSPEGVQLLQAPVKTRTEANPIQPPMTFAHLLHNVGFADVRELAAMVEAWRNLYALVRPDLIVFDHCPTGLLAARGLSARRVIIGSGFCIPPDEHPLPNLRPWLKADPEKLAGDESAIVNRMNRVLESLKQPSLQRITQLYREVDEMLLVTFKELDHYPERTNATYWGTWPDGGGKAPLWPAGKGKRIYAYLKPFKALPGLLKALNELGNPTLVVGDGIAAGIRERFSSTTLWFESERLEMMRVARECDLAILNAGHGSTAAVLMAGRPVLLAPIYLEQGLLSRAVTRRLGAGVEASHRDGEHIAQRLQAALAADECRIKAGRFAERYADFSPKQQEGRMLQRLCEMI